jgi:hypothetical protein
MQHLIDLDKFDYEIDDYAPVFVKFGEHYINPYVKPQYDRLTLYRKTRNGYDIVN